MFFKQFVLYMTILCWTQSWSFCPFKGKYVLGRCFLRTGELAVQSTCTCQNVVFISLLRENCGLSFSSLSFIKRSPFWEMLRLHFFKFDSGGLRQEGLFGGPRVHRIGNSLGIPGNSAISRLRDRRSTADALIQTNSDRPTLFTAGFRSDRRRRNPGKCNLNLLKLFLVLVDLVLSNDMIKVHMTTEENKWDVRFYTERLGLSGFDLNPREGWRGSR